MEIQVLSATSQEDIKSLLKEIGVHEAGIEIMSDKAISRLIKIKHLPSWIANILKQEILSLNGDVAINRDAITGRVKYTDCLIMGNLRQLNQFIEKLQSQPASLKNIASQIKSTLDDFERRDFIIPANGFRLNLKKRTALMAIVNLTPDSFSGDGLLGKMGIDFIERHIYGLVKDGADIIDIGGESTRPGARVVSAQEEISRTIPVIKRIARKIKIPISIDTYKPEVAKRALDAGASIVNNIKGVQNNPAMLRIVKRFGAALVLMHIKGNPKTMQRKPEYKDLLGEIIGALKKSVDIACSWGIKSEKIILDPGIGFGKTLGQNLEIIQRLAELKSLGKPILIGVSRKSFIGRIAGCPLKERLFGTAAAVAQAVINGANIVRVHDCRSMKQVVKLTDSILYN